jgi:O-antigen ligase
VVLLGIAYVLTGRSRQRTVMYLLAATAPLEVYRTAVSKLDVSLFRLSLLIALLVLLADAPRQQLRRWSRQPLVVSYLALDLIIVVALFAHPINTFLGERQIAIIAIGIVALATIGELARRESLERAARAIVVGSILPLAGAVWQAVGPRIGASGALPLLDQLPAAEGLEITRQALSSFGPIGVRAKGTFGDPNHFAVYLVLVACVAGALFLVEMQRRNRRGQITFGAMTTAAFATLIATFSRSGWVAGAFGALTIGGGVVALWRVGTIRAPRRRASILTVVLALAVLAGVAPSVVKRIVPSSQINVASDRYHASTVRFAFKQFTAHPAIGIGPGGLGIKLHEQARTSGAHSSYLTAAAELGAPGILILLLIAGIALRTAYRGFRASLRNRFALIPLALGGAYVGYLVANVTYDIWFDDFVWVLLGGVAATRWRASLDGSHLAVTDARYQAGLPSSNDLVSDHERAKPGLSQPATPDVRPA